MLFIDSPIIDIITNTRKFLGKALKAGIGSFLSKHADLKEDKELMKALALLILDSAIYYKFLK